MKLLFLIFPIIILLCLSFFGAWSSDAIYVPSTMNIITFLAVLWLIISIKNSYARSVCAFWCVWFVLGTISLFSQNQLDSGLNYKFDPHWPNQYYLLCVGSAAVIIKIFELAFSHTSSSYPIPLTRGSNPISWTILLVFPFLYAASVILATGGVPMFSGKDVSAEMYEVNYGPLHAFGIFISVSCVMVWAKIGSPESLASRSYIKLFATLFLVLLIVIAAMDGRRALAIFALFGIILFSVAQPSTVRQRLQTAAVAILALVGYVAASAIRSGGQASQAFADIYLPLSTIGVEYRDFAYGFDRLSPNQVLAAGYNWFGSTAAALIPGGLLSAMGYSKLSLVQTDSARTLMSFWNVKLGIRIGLPGELWFAYQWWGIAVFAGLGAVVFLFSNWANKADHFVYRSILLIFLSLWATSVLGQSTVTFGLVLPLVYLSILVYAAEIVTSRVKPRTGPRQIFRDV